MADRRRNHFIPRFLLKRFASRRKNDKSWVWQISRDSKAVEVSTRDAAVAADFYGGPTTGIEDMFGSAETRFSRVLSSIDRGDTPLSHAETLRELIWTLVVRTRALREQFTETLDQFLDVTVESVASSEAQDALTRHVRTNWDRIVGEALHDLRPVHGVDPKFFLEDSTFKDELRNSAEELVGVLGPVLLSQFLRGVRDKGITAKASEEGQIKGLKNLLEGGKLPDTFLPGCWQVYNVESQRLILGDGCIVAVGEDGSVGSMLRSDNSWQAVYLPISDSMAVVARREGPGSFLSVRELNAASAALSSSYIYASQVDDSVLEIAREIGNGDAFLSAEKISEIVAEGWKDLAKSN